MKSTLSWLTLLCITATYMYTAILTDTVNFLAINTHLISKIFILYICNILNLPSLLKGDC